MRYSVPLFKILYTIIVQICVPDLPTIVKYLSIVASLYKY